MQEVYYARDRWASADFGPEECRMFYMDRKISTCVDCNEKIDPKQVGVFWESHGWAEYRGALGGTNNLRFRTQTGRVLCAKCAQIRSSGTKGQGGLF